MDEQEHPCEGCKVLHRARYWYYREGRTDIYCFREWLCAARYLDIAVADRQQWRASTPD